MAIRGGNEAVKIIGIRNSAARDANIEYPNGTSLVGLEAAFVRRFRSASECCLLSKAARRAGRTEKGCAL